MKIISWNVNGLRSAMSKGFMEFFEDEQAEVFCIQETKMHHSQAEFSFPGYYEYWNSAQRKGYSGTAVFTRIKPISVSFGMGIEKHDTEGRIITLEFDEFFLVNVYSPNSQQELARLSYRMEWEDDFKEYVKALDCIKPVVICGDLNVAHKEIDLKNPKSNRNNAGFTDEEREKLSYLLASGFTDTYRHFYPDREGAYTWWSYMYGARSRNAGWRIDYFIVSDRLLDKVSSAEIYSEIGGSDHCPVGIEIF
ncbi:MAG: Exodeoxyribonuclease [Firmicutes bacterium ADurb.Bin193]|nr:MAG: Exodeoxyribonuclease [Firmicutes bacterium ADurb.Bin193]